MKKFSLLLVSIALCHATMAQLLINQGDITINSGEILTIQGEYRADASSTLDNKGTIVISGNWTNNSGNAGFLDTQIGTVSLNGSGQQIGGSSATTFNLLNLNTASGNVSLNRPIAVNQQINLGGRSLDLNQQTISIANPLASAINYTTGGFINQSGSFDAKVIWHLGTANGIRIVPFVTSGGVPVPIQMNITTAGTGAGNMMFSAFSTSADNTPLPSGITKTPFSKPYSAVDRFWQVEPSGYSTNPISNVVIRYTNTEIAAPNTIAEPLLKAYYWNSTDWVEWVSGSNTNPNEFTLNGVNNYGTISLSSELTPLPIVLLNIQAKPREKDILVAWEIAQAINHKNFELERSENGKDFTAIATIEGGNNVATVARFQYEDQQVMAQKLYYYRLRFNDIDGKYTYSPIVTARIDANRDFVGNVFPNPNYGKFSVEVKQGTARTVHYKIFDNNGALKVQNQLYIAENQPIIDFELPKIAAGMYYLILSDELSEQPIKHKIILLN